MVPLFRSAHDTILGSLDIKRPGSKFRRLPTKVFTEFIKGITYFATDSVRERPSELQIKEKFRREHGYFENSANDNREHLKTCLIERMIYNCIYEAILHKQDLAHLQELEEISDLFPNSNIHVSVSHYQGTPQIYPTHLLLIMD